MAQIRLETNILLQDLVNEIGFIELEGSQMREVYLHRRFFALFDLLSLVDVELDGVAVLLVAISAVVVIWVIFAKLEPTG